LQHKIRSVFEEYFYAILRKFKPPTHFATDTSKHVNAALKDELSEQHMPERLIVVATSNDVSTLDEALLQRFDVFPFSAGPTFAEACRERLAWIWQREAGSDVPFPAGVEQLGWRKDNFSMRRALAALSGALELHRTAEVAA